MNILSGFLNSYGTFGGISSLDISWEDTGPFAFTCTFDSCDVTSMYSMGLAGGSWFAVSGITNCEVTTGWKGWTSDMLSSNTDSCRVTLGGRDVLFDSLAMTGYVSEANQFKLSYQQTAAVPEPSTFAMLLIGLFCVLKRCGAFGESSWLKSTRK